MKKVILFGSRGHAKTVIDILEKQNLYQIIGIFTDKAGMIGTELMGYPILGKIADFHGSNKGIVALGDNYARYSAVNRILQINPAFQFIKAIHPSAVIGRNVEISLGTVIVGGVVINPFAKIGMHCIINTKASVGHDVKIGDYSTIAPGATIAGNTTIGTLSTIAMGANVIHKLKIGNGTVIGAGSTVIRDIPDGVLAYGLPAKVIRSRLIDERYY